MHMHVHRLIAVDHGIDKIANMTQEPAFYQRLREELDDEEFVDLLQQSSATAAHFGLSKLQFKELKEYSRFKGVVF